MRKKDHLNDKPCGADCECMRKIDNRSITKRRRNCIGNQSTEDEIGKKYIGCQVLERPGFAPLVFFDADVKVCVVHSPAGGMYGAKSGALSPVL